MGFLRKEQPHSPWPMQDEGDLFAFDELSRRQKFLTLVGLTIAAWTLLGVAAILIYQAFAPHA